MCCWNFVAKLVKMYIHVQCYTWHLLGEIQSADGSFDYMRFPRGSAGGAWQPNLECVFFSFIVFTWVFGMSNLPTCYCWGLGWWHYAWRLCAGTRSPKGVSLVGGTTMFHMDLSSSWQYRSYLYKAKRCLTNLSIVPLWDAVGVLSCMIIYLYDMYLCWCWFTVWLSMTVWMILFV